jgi:hypothetical protein
MACSLQELVAASAMITALERIASSGTLPVGEEIEIRLLIVRAGNAFMLDSIAERHVSNVIQIGDHDAEYSEVIDSVGREMGRV